MLEGARLVTTVVAEVARTTDRNRVVAHRVVTAVAAHGETLLIVRAVVTNLFRVVTLRVVAQKALPYGEAAVVPVGTLADLERVVAFGVFVVLAADDEAVATVLAFCLLALLRLGSLPHRRGRGRGCGVRTTSCRRRGVVGTTGGRQRGLAPVAVDVKVTKRVVRGGRLGLGLCLGFSVSLGLCRGFSVGLGLDLRRCGGLSQLSILVNLTEACELGVVVNDCLGEGSVVEHLTVVIEELAEKLLAVGLDVLDDQLLAENLVILNTLILVAEDLVGGVDESKLLVGFGSAAVAVRVPQHRQATMRLLDLFHIRRNLHEENIVRVESEKGSGNAAGHRVVTLQKVF